MDYTLFIDAKGYLCARVSGKMAIEKNFPGFAHLNKSDVIITVNGIAINNNDNVYYRLIDMIPYSMSSFHKMVSNSCYKHSMTAHEIDMLIAYFGEDVFTCDDVFDTTNYTVRACASLKIASV